MAPTPLKHVLVVDDEDGIRSFLRQVLEGAGWTVHEASSGTAGIERLEEGRYDVVLTDLKMPGADGLEVLRTAKTIQPDAEVILMTGFGTVDTAVEAMRAGAFHYILKPIRATEAANLVDKAYAQRQLARENLFLKGEVRGAHPHLSIVGTSPAIQQAEAAAKRLAETDAPVLLEGERGSGRELFAKIIHYNSSRSGSLFVPVRCGGAPQDVIESDLFGHAAGAYLDATLRRIGKADLANHGTLFLADIDRAGPAVLRGIRTLLTTKTIAPVGTSGDVEIDVRVVASCRPDLDALVEKGDFPGALRDAFRPARIRLPALRERTEDIPLLLNQHLFESNRDRKKPLLGFSEAAIKALSAYSWPGNVRELRDLVKNVAARKKRGTVVGTADLPPEMLYGHAWKEGTREPPAAVAPDIRHAIEDVERPMVLQALALAGGDREKAARLLDVDVDDLVTMIRKHAIDE